VWFLLFSSFSFTSFHLRSELRKLEEEREAQRKLDEAKRLEEQAKADEEARRIKEEEDRSVRTRVTQFVFSFLVFQFFRFSGFYYICFV
jgi:hypothetical protein